MENEELLEPLELLKNRILNYKFNKKSIDLFIELEFINPKCCSCFKTKDITTFNSILFRSKYSFKFLNIAFSEIVSNKKENPERQFRAFLALMFLTGKAKFDGFTKLLSTGGDSAKLSYELAKLIFLAEDQINTSISSERILALYMTKEP